MEIQRAFDGRANLHIWREGQEYWRQKSPIFLKDWTNIVFSVLPYPRGGRVLHHDLRRPLPSASETFDAISAYHVMEHLTPSEGRRFIAELFRVLKPGSVCRVSVPDLERICRDYLEWLEICLGDPSPKNVRAYQWSVWELFDQAVREKAGGKMLEALERDDLDTEFIKSRYKDVFNPFYGEATPEPVASEGNGAPVGFAKRLRAKSPAQIFDAIFRRANAAAWRCVREWKLRRAKGNPRATGEAAQWMYDRVSLRRVLEEQGFIEWKLQTYKTSDIPNWDRYNLDQSNHGDHEIDPSIYFEARKPLTREATA